MVEWFKAAVLKTAEGQLSEGSNPSFSAILVLDLLKKVPFGTVLGILPRRELSGKYPQFRAGHRRDPGIRQ